MSERRAFFGWPGWSLLAYVVFLGLVVTAWWILLFHGANAITVLRAFRVRLHTDLELQIPFIPAAVLLYMSIYLQFWSAPFILRQRREAEGLALSLMAVTAVAFAGFMLFPADSHFPPQTDLGIWAELIH